MPTLPSSRRPPSTGSATTAIPGRSPTYRGALGVNLVLNGGWSWLFFNRHQLGASAAAAAALIVSSADLASRAVSALGVRGAPLVACPLWCAFATVLSTHVWLLNRRRRVHWR